jgi:AcrR family transcriptional regulator
LAGISWKDICDRINRVIAQSNERCDVNRPELILQITLDLVNEFGFVGTTISKISKRAQVSPGIIYHYFQSKDEIIHQLYKNIEEEFVGEVQKLNPLNLPILACYKQFWISMYHFCVNHPQKMVFIEAYQNSAYFKDCISTARFDFLKNLSVKNESSIAKGELKDLPIETIFAMTGRVSIELAKLTLKGQDPLKGNSVDFIAEAVCRSVLV